MNIIASAAGHTFTRTSKVAWTHATITAYESGYVQVNWAKSENAAENYASYKRQTLATPDQYGADNKIVSVDVVATSIA